MTDSTTSVPEPLPPAERAMLDAYRAGRGMPAQAKARLIERLEAPPLVRAGVSRGWVVAGVGIAAAVALTWGASALQSKRASVVGSQATDQAAMQGVDGATGGAAVPRSPASAAERDTRRHPIPTARDDADPVDSMPPGSTPLQHPPADEGTDPVSSPAEGGADPEAPRRRRGDPTPGPSSAPAAAIEPTPAPSQLSQERAILGRAWAALAVGDHGTALLAADEHAERFPSGTLVVERRAMAAVASCKAKRPGWAALADTFLELHGKTPLARRVREACAGSNDAE